MFSGVKLSDPFDVAGPMDNAKETKPQKKSPHAFLGENSALVNLDNLVTVTSKLDISSQQGTRSYCSRHLDWQTSILIFFLNFSSAFTHSNGEPIRRITSPGARRSRRTVAEFLSTATSSEAFHKSDKTAAGLRKRSIAFATGTGCESIPFLTRF